MLANLVGRQAIDVREPFLDELNRVAVELVEVVRGVERLALPLEPEPADVLLDGVDVLRLFFRGVRVVESEVAGSPELLARPRN